MRKREADELTLIEDNITVDEATSTIWFHYPLIKDPVLLSDNWAQAIAIETGVQERLMKNGQLEAYNDVVGDYIEREVFKELSDAEMEAWDGPVNYISHHDVPKPSSVSTAMRIVSNSSLKNTQSGGISYNDLLVKGPNSLQPLLQVQADFRTLPNVVTWDYAKAYNTVLTYPEGRGDAHASLSVERQ